LQVDGDGDRADESLVGTWFETCCRGIGSHVRRVRSGPAAATSLTASEFWIHVDRSEVHLSEAVPTIRLDRPALRRARVFEAHARRRYASAGVPVRIVARSCAVVRGSVARMTAAMTAAPPAPARIT